MSKLLTLKKLVKGLAKQFETAAGITIAEDFDNMPYEDLKKARLKLALTLKDIKALERQKRGN